MVNAVRHFSLSSKILHRANGTHQYEILAINYCVNQLVITVELSVLCWTAAEPSHIIRMIFHHQVLNERTNNNFFLAATAQMGLKAPHCYGF
jgi:hypothetical protein